MEREIPSFTDSPASEENAIQFLTWSTFLFPSVFWARAGCWLAERVTWPQSTTGIQWQTSLFSDNVTKQTTRQTFDGPWDLPLVTARPRDPSFIFSSIVSSCFWKNEGKKKKGTSGPGRRARRLYFPVSQRIISQFLQLEAFRKWWKRKKRNEKKKKSLNGKTEKKNSSKKQTNCTAALHPRHTVFT